MTIQERIERLRGVIGERLARAERATPGPWQVWSGHLYVGGGADLCIGSGETWLANMDHRTCTARPCHQGQCDLESDSDIASTSGCRCREECPHENHITEEQAANADFIAAARQEHPQAHRALLTLLGLFDVPAEFLTEASEIVISGWLSKIEDALGIGQEVQREG